jgi:hypothetical protein
VFACSLSIIIFSAQGLFTKFVGVIGCGEIAAVREYMDAKKWKEADIQIPQVAQVIENSLPELTGQRRIWKGR